MPAVRLVCTQCGRRYWASRSDALYCGSRCRTAARQENAKFEVPIIPRSGVQGVTFNRRLKKWEARVKIDRQWKFIGVFHTVDEAVTWQRQVSGNG